MKLNKLLGWMGMVTLIMTSSAFAEEAAAAASGDTGAYAKMGAALALGLAAFGGATGQSKAAAAALEGIARNPAAAEKLNTPMILSLVFMESLVLFTFVVTIMVITK